MAAGFAGAAVLGDEPDTSSAPKTHANTKRSGGEVMSRKIPQKR
jgi:hypothetical protein